MNEHVQGKSVTKQSVPTTAQIVEINSSTPSASSLEKILSLHHTIGNRAVQRLLKDGYLQAKLSVSQPGDIYEQEADQVAEQMMRKANPALQTKTACPTADCHQNEDKGHLKIRCKADVTYGADNISVSDDFVSALGPGSSLDKPIKDYFEPRFGFDLGNVRVHASQQAAETAGSINARAYTLGNNIVFGAGEYQQHTESGKRLIAHELAHVVQQAGPVVRRSTANDSTSTDGLGPNKNCRIRAGATRLVLPSNKLIELPENTLVKIKKPLVTDKNKISWATILVLSSVKEEQAGLNGLIQASSLVVCAEQDVVADANDSNSAPKVEQAKASDKGTENRVENVASQELTDQDAKACSSLYLHKLCVRELGGCTGTRDAGQPSQEELSSYNASCRQESGYTGPDVSVSGKECEALQSPACERGTPARIRSARVGAALERSVKYMPAGIGAELVRLITDPVFLGSMAVAVGVYLALWLAPEPVFTKIAAAATTLAILGTGCFTISTLINLANAWGDLENEAGSAQSDEEIEQAAERFGTRMGATEADLLVFLASLLVGGKLPGPKRLPPPSQALAQAERSLAVAKQGGVVIEGPWGRARAVAPGGEPAPGASPPASYGRSGNLALKVEPAPASPPSPEGIPANDVVPETMPANDNALPIPGSKQTTAPVTPVVPGLAPGKDDAKKKKRPPFVLRLPLQKAPHLETYRSWLGVLQSDPNYERGHPAQLDKWHQALRLGGSHAIPSYVYERGHKLGFVGENGERRIRVPDWSRTKSVSMEVDHIIELQVTPTSMRDDFNSMENYELLDRISNGTSGPLIQSNILAERQKQIAFDPSAKDRVLLFDEVTLDSGSPGERWGADEIRAGEHLDEYKKRR